MNILSEKILSDYQVRKTWRQKTEFLDMMKKEFSDGIIEEGGFPKSRNFIIGDIQKARVVFCAHYDTCAALPFPNLIMPKNIFMTLLYNVLICIPFILVMFVASFLIGLITDSFLVNYFGTLFAFVAVFVGVFFLGVPNRHTANDNTSGVVTLCELISELSDEQRCESAFVFFDNEENGLLGSSFFRKKHKNLFLEKLVINFDCVSDGDNMLLVIDKNSKRKYGEKLVKAFRDTDSKKAWHENASTTFYPSDQVGFPMSVAVSSMKHKRLFGLYMDRIHTNRDTIFDRDNIKWIVESVRSFLS